MAGEYHTTDARSGQKAPVPKIESYGDYLSNGYLDKMTAMGQQHEWKLSKNHARYQKAKLYPRSGANSVLHSVRNVNSQLNEYAQKKENDKQSPQQLANHPKPSYNYKPSALNLFPHIGFIDKQEIYTTQNAVRQREVNNSSKQMDAFDLKRYYHHREAEHNKLQESHIHTKIIMIDRKFKNVGSKNR